MPKQILCNLEPYIRQIGVKMKRKKLYIMCACLLIACVIYTIVGFTTPENQEQEQSVFTNALQLVENSFTNIDETDDSVIVEEAGFSLLPKTASSTGTSEEAEVEENTEEEIVSTASLTQEEVKSTEDVDELKTTEEEVSEEDDEIVTILSISDSSCDDEDIAISIASSYVNIREDASTDSKILGKLYKDNAAHILKTEGDWLYIESGNVTGYVKAEYVISGLTEDELARYGTVTATVNTDGLNVRQDASTEAKRVDVIYMGERYPVLEDNDDWIKLDIEDDNVQGYVKAEYVIVSMTFTEAISIEEENALKKAQEAAKLEATLKANASEVATVYGSSTNYSNDELMLLACLIHAEAGNQTYEGKLAVANVVLNRVKSSKFANSISGVIYQKGQFSVASSGSLKKQLNQYSSYNSNSQKLSIQAAKDALAGVNNIGKRLYFNRYSSTIAKKHSDEGGVKIDDQFFW